MTGDPRFAHRDTPRDEICLVRHPLWLSKPGCGSARCSILKRVEHDIHSWDGLLYWRTCDTGWMHGPERAPDDKKTMG
jgi:hypothetical protein